MNPLTTKIKEYIGRHDTGKSKRRVSFVLVTVTTAVTKKAI